MRTKPLCAASPEARCPLSFCPTGLYAVAHGMHLKERMGL